MLLRFIFWVAFVVVVGSSTATASPDTASQQQQHIVVTCIPLNGHFFPIKAIMEELLRRGHIVTLLTETKSWCLEGVDPLLFRCVLVPPSGAFPVEMLERVSHLTDLMSGFALLFEGMVAHHNTTLGAYIQAMDDLFAASPPPSGLLTDMSTFVSAALATKYSLPRVQVYPLTMRLTFGPSTWLPQLGQGAPRNMGPLDRLTGALIGVISSLYGVLVLMPTLNAQRERHGIAPYRNVFDIAGAYDVTLAPTVWSYDIPQPLCPNVVPLGTLVPDHSREPPMESDVEAFLTSVACTSNGALYVNFGTLSVMSARLRNELLALFLDPDFAPCVLWKPDRASVGLVKSFLEQQGHAPSITRKVLVSPYFVNAFEIMKHPSVRAFLTHCGDTSFGEAVEALLPLIGIPFFADQVDVCQRMSEVGAGTFLGNKDDVTAEDLRRVLHTYFNGPGRNKDVVHRMELLRDMARYLGGAARGADIIEAHTAYRLGDSLRCVDLDPVVLGTADSVTGATERGVWRQLVAVARVAQWHLSFVTTVLPLTIIMLVAVKVTVSFCRRCRRRR